MLQVCKLAALLMLGMLLAACAGSGGRRADLSGPAVWQVEQHGESLWLVGTVHRLPPQAFANGLETRVRRSPAWWTPALQQAMLRADELVLEMIEAPDRAPIAAVAAALDGEAANRERLEPGQLALLSRTARRYGLSEREVLEVEPVSALLAFAYLGVPASESAAPAVDVILERWAKQRNKSVRGLETITERVAASSEALLRADRARRDELLLRYVADIAQGDAFDASYHAMLEAWQSGRMDLFDQAVQDYRETEPELHEAFLVARNRLWLDRIVGLLGNGRNEVVAVGVAHLAGPDSLLELLQARGIRLERVDAGAANHPDQRGRLKRVTSSCRARQGPGGFLCCTAAC